MATLAVTPPNVGSANKQINGSFASPSLATAAEVLAICIRERIPSCILAPPEVVTKITGSLVSSARSIARQIFSPTTDPMLPPIKLKSNTQSTTRRPFIIPSPITMASLRPVFS